MSKWHFIQDKPLLREIYNETLIISYKRGKSLGDILIRALKVTGRSLNTLSQAYESCLAHQHLPPNYAISVAEWQTFLLAKPC